jgi:hypothetical protein
VPRPNSGSSPFSAWLLKVAIVASSCLPSMPILLASSLSVPATAPSPAGQSWPGVIGPNGYFSRTWLSMMTQQGKFGCV